MSKNNVLVIRVDMPKIFSSEERDRIVDRLRSVASSALSIYGVKKTTVDYLVEEAHIAKGSFYLFYESKEELFCDVFLSFLSRVKNLYLEMLQNMDENHIVTSLSGIFVSISELIYKEGMFRFLDEDNLIRIERKVDKRRVEEIRECVNSLFHELFSYFSIDSDEDVSSFIESYRAIITLFLLPMEEKKREGVMRVLIKGLVLQLVE